MYICIYIYIYIVFILIYELFVLLIHMSGSQSGHIIFTLSGRTAAGRSAAYRPKVAKSVYVFIYIYIYVYKK